MPEGKPTILVTGAGGELGHQVLQRLSEQATVVGVDFREASHYDDQMVQYRVDFSKRDFEDLFKDYSFDGVIHLGRIQSSELSRSQRYNTNVLGTQKLLELSLKYHVSQVIILSTYHVYGADPYNPFLINESYPMKAANLTAELVDAVELENLAMVYLLKYPELHLTVLRPCNIVGPGIQNSISQLLKQEYSPALLGFSPLMQFIHVEDLADAVVRCHERVHPGVYNIAPDDWVPYQEALIQSGSRPIPILSIPPQVPQLLFKLLHLKQLPAHLLNYYKYSVIMDGSLFQKTFSFVPNYTLKQIFTYYAQLKGN